MPKSMADYKWEVGTVFLDPCKDSFVSCRPIIGLDDCFLKGKYKGELLSVVGRDSNDQLLPLAYAVVEVENKETWTWFLELLIGDLGGIDVCGTMTFIIVQQKVCLIYVQFINFCLLL